MAGRGVSLTQEGPVAMVIFSRPPVNALDRACLEAIDEKVAEAAAHPDVKLIALAGRGHNFSAGTDIGEQRRDTVADLLATFHALVRRLLTCEVPTVALVQGQALGGGAELALACDFVFAETTSTIGFPEIRLGVFPPVASVLLERRVGRARAADLILCGSSLSAENAERRGLVNALVNPGDLIHALETIRDRLEPFSTSTLRLAKRALRLGTAADPLAALAEVEKLYLTELMSTEDAHEGIAAFLEKRSPVWKGR